MHRHVFLYSSIYLFQFIVPSRVIDLKMFLSHRFQLHVKLSYYGANACSGGTFAYASSNAIPTKLLTLK